jgi:DNA-directed RNA polymerase subunit M
MYPKENVFICNKCGLEKKKTGSNLVVTKQTKKEVAVFEEKINVLPKTKVKCPKCGHNEAYWILRQMRGSDEPETRFFTCAKCEYKWREN